MSGLPVAHDVVYFQDDRAYGHVAVRVRRGKDGKVEHVEKYVPDRPVTEDQMYLVRVTDDVIANGGDEFVVRCEVVRALLPRKFGAYFEKGKFRGKPQAEAQVSYVGNNVKIVPDRFRGRGVRWGQVNKVRFGRLLVADLDRNFFVVSVLPEKGKVETVFERDKRRHERSATLEEIVSSEGNGNGGKEKPRKPSYRERRLKRRTGSGITLAEAAGRR